MVKRSVLEKLSNKDLLRYTSEDTRSVPEAIEMAFDILKKRGYFFSETEIVKINQLIASRKKEEPDYKSLNTWDIDEDAEKASVSFYSQKAIWYFSILFGLFTGAILLAINLFTLSKKKEAWATLLFGFGYTLALILVYNEFKDYFRDTEASIDNLKAFIDNLEEHGTDALKSQLQGVKEKLNADPFAALKDVGKVIANVEMKD
ncbi:MAG: hypothetical protein ACN6PI_23660, partial [Sphingobacterium siyangense]